MSTTINQEKGQKLSNDIKLLFDVLTDNNLAYTVLMVLCNLYEQHQKFIISFSYFTVPYLVMRLA